MQLDKTWSPSIDAAPPTLEQVDQLKRLAKRLDTRDLMLPMLCAAGVIAAYLLTPNGLPVLMGMGLLGLLVMIFFSLLVISFSTMNNASPAQHMLRSGLLDAATPESIGDLAESAATHQQISGYLRQVEALNRPLLQAEVRMLENAARKSIPQ